MEKRKHRGLSCLNKNLEHSPGVPGASSVLYRWEHRRQLMLFIALTVLQTVLSPCTGSFAWYWSTSELYAKERNPTYCCSLKIIIPLFQRLSIVCRHILRAKLIFSLPENPNWPQFSEICIHALSVFLYRLFENRSPVLAPEGAAFP